MSAHVDNLRAEDSPYCSELPYMGLRRSIIWDANQSRLALIAEREPISFAQLMEDIFN